jgi:hypothetical protein
VAFTVTATAGSPFLNGILLRVKVLTSAAATQNGASATAAAAYQKAITTTVAGSIVYGALADDGSFTANAATTVTDNTPGSAGTQLGSCRQTTPTVTPGSVTIGATASGPDGGVALFEVKPAGTIAEDASAPAAASSTSLTAISSPSFTPPAGSLLVLMVSALAASMAITDTSGLGLTWTQQSAMVTDGYAGVWTAQVPGSGITGTGSLALPAPKLAGTGTYTPGPVTGTGSLALPAPALAGSGTATPPGITGTGSLQLPAPALAGASARRLILSIAPRAGTDGSGNTYPQGISVGAKGSQQVQMLLSGVAAFLGFPSGAAFEGSTAQIAAAEGGISPAQYIAMLIQSAATTTTGARDTVALQFNSAAADNSSSANLGFIYTGSNGVRHQFGFLDITGLNIQAGSIIAADPGGNPPVPESWHALALINGYTAGANNGFVDVPMIRMMADNKTLAFKGTLKAPASGFAAPFAALPAGYPGAGFGGPYGKAVVANLSGTVTDHLQVQGNSNLSIENAAASISYDISCMVQVQ